jgi:hypothetical protein
LFRQQSAEAVFGRSIVEINVVIPPEFKRYGIVLTMICMTTAILSAFWKVPYLYTFIGFAAWIFAGHLITIDDDFPGGWSNPDGSSPLPWRELAIKTAVLLGLVGLIFFFPALRALGA